MSFINTDLYKYVESKNGSQRITSEYFKVLSEANIAYESNLFFIAMSGYWVFTEFFIYNVFTF